MKKLFSFLLGCSCFGATWTIDAGSTRIGNTRYTQSAPVTVTTTGNPGSTSRSFIYVDTNGTLNISLPPGVNGTCSGAPCRIFTTDASGASHYLGGGHAFATNRSDGLYWIDPIFNTTSSQSGAYSLLANVPPPITTAGGEGFASSSYEVDMKFKSSTNGYILGVRFYRVAADTSTDQIGTLFSDIGTSLATANFNVSGTGWQTVYFASPVAITAGVYYRASLHSNGGTVYRNGFFTNAIVANGSLSTAATFNSGNGACDSSDAFPQTTTGFTNGGTTLTSVAVVGCVDIQSNGAINPITPFFGEGSGHLGYTQWNMPEGAQVMQGGKGPGPYAVINTVLSNSGNQWHHDSSGGYRKRQNFWYYRDIIQWPATLRTGAPGSDGFQYISRQLLEWKAGTQIHIEGTIFQNAWNDAVGSSLMLALGNRDGGTHDVWVGNNEFRHGPGVVLLGSQYQEGAPPARNYFGNNLVWDINSYASRAQANTGAGWLFEGGGPSEDTRVEHNTVFPLRGYVPALWHTFVGDQRDGMKVTDNVFPVDSMTHGFNQEQNWCNGVNSGEATIGPACSKWGNYQITNNVFYPAVWSVTDTAGGDTIHPSNASNQTQAGIQSMLPTLSSTNYIPGSNDLSTYGFFRTTSLPVNTDNVPSNPDAHLRHTSLLLASSGYKSTDGKDLGADINAIDNAEGKLQAVSIPASLLTSHSAVVTFVAPDAQSCPVDYAVFDSTDPYLINSFQRVADAATARNRAVSLTGLASGTVYRVRIDCAAFQPLLLFRTP